MYRTDNVSTSHLTRWFIFIIRNQWDKFNNIINDCL